MIPRNRSVKIVVILKNMTPRTKVTLSFQFTLRFYFIFILSNIIHCVFFSNIDLFGYRTTSCQREGNVFGAIHQFELRVVPDDFQLDYDRAEDRITVTSTMNTAYRTHKIECSSITRCSIPKKRLEHPYPDMNKEEWTRVCDLFASEEFQRRSAINKENRAKLKIVHTSGARSFQRARALLKNPESDEISPALLYKKTHTNKDGMWTSEDARENFEKMEALQLQYKSEGKSYTEVEIFAEVLGTKAGYVKV
ncbi:hypothetical protein CJ030_MR5G020713 [Morella rubra]|uniref:Uncharacterized protein n=1 Tax=Morella rubra TaxID=262757 RepID=A0A6A1VN54_9ROSI|nr:hypothetical protein CJ030_MR5G020713 [Morella rubra]